MNVGEVHIVHYVAQAGGNVPMQMFKVATKSSPKAVAGAIASVIQKEGAVELRAVGAGAVNQAVKAIAIARGFAAPRGINLICVPGFLEVDIEGEQRTAIRFRVEPRRYA